MGFSLRNLVKHVGADLNPFDGPQRPQQRSAPPQPASTARPQGNQPQGGFSGQGGQNPLSVQPVRQQSLIPAIQPVQAPPPLQVHVAAAQPLQVGNTTIQPNPQARTGVQGYQPPKLDFTHNPVTNFAGGIVKPIASIPLDISNQIYNRAVAPTFNLPKQDLSHQQGLNPFISSYAKDVGATGSLHQAVADTVQGGLALASGGLTNLAEKGATGVAGFVAPKLASEASTFARLGLNQVKTPLNTAIKYGTGALAGGGINAGFGASQAAGQGASPTQILKSGAESGAVGVGLGLAAPVVGAGIKGGVKLAAQKIDNRTPLNINNPTPGMNPGAVGKNTQGWAGETAGYHGSTNPNLTQLDTGAKLGLNEKRNLIYLSDTKSGAAPYTKVRAADGTLTNSPTGKVYPVSVGGKIIDSGKPADIASLKTLNGYDSLSPLTKRHIDNAVSMNNIHPDILEHNPQLVKYLSDNGINGVKTHFPNSPGDKQIIVTNPSAAKLQNPAQPIGVGKNVTPEQASLNATEQVATAKTAKTGEGPVSQYDLRRGINVDPKHVTAQDKIEASYSSTTPEQIAGQRLVSQHNADAERAALEHLQNGGTRDGAAAIYQQAAGATLKDAKFRVQRAAKQAKTPLRPNEGGVNPELSTFDNSPIAAGDYATGKSRYKTVNNLADFHQKQSLKALDKLTPTDRTDFVHYVQGTKDIAKAEHPANVQAAVDTFRKGADTIHALDTQFSGGKTRYIKNFFPDYWDTPANQALLQHKAEQQLEEQMGPDAWRSLTNDERAQALGEFQQHTSLDTGNYQGFRDKGRIFANRQEGLNANFQPRFADPAGDIKNYFTSAKLKVAPQALINATRKADINATSLGNPISLPGKTSFETSDAGNQVLKGLARRSPSKADIFWKPYDTVSSAATQAIVLNPIFHGANQLVQGFVASGRSLGLKAGPGGGLSFVKNAMSMGTKDAVEYSRRFLEDGGHYPTYGKNSQGIIATATHGVSNVNRSAMAGIEARLRTSTYKTLVDSGMNGKEAVKAIDHYLGGGDAFSPGTHRGTIFLHYFKTMAEALGGHVIHPIENAGSTVNLVIAAAAVYGASKAFQEVTGNPNAYVRAPGELGLAKELINSAKEIKDGHYRQSLGVLTNRINPVAKEGAQQLFNQDLFTGKSLDESGGRGAHAAQGLIAPLQSGSKVTSGKKSVPELIANQLQLNTPHARTNPAAPKLPFLNNKTVTVNGQKVPVTIAQGNDPTGYQQQKVYYKTVEDSQKGMSPEDKKRLNGLLTSEVDSNGVHIGANDKQAQAKNAQLYAHPDDLKRITKQKQDFAKLTGQKVDPLYDPNLTDAQRLIYVKLQSLPYKGDEYVHLSNQNKDWLRPFETNRSAYFKSQPQNLISKSKRVQPPSFPNSTNSLLDQADNLTGKDKGTFIADNPALQDAYTQLAGYTANKIAAQGNAPRDTYLTATPAEENIIKTYNAIPKGGGKKGGNLYRSQWINAHPQEYAAMSHYYTQASLYGLEKDAAQAQFQDTGFSSKGLGDIVNLAKYDISKQTDANGNTFYALGSGGTGSFGSSYGGYAKSGGRKSTANKKNISSFIASSQKINAVNSKNQNALLKLVKGSKLKSSGRKLNVTKVALKKQSARKTSYKTKVKVA